MEASFSVISFDGKIFRIHQVSDDLSPAAVAMSFSVKTGYPSCVIKCKNSVMDILGHSDAQGTWQAGMKGGVR